MHLHHIVLGILLLFGVGYLWLAQVGTEIGRSLDWPSRLTALLYGVGAALTLDEFALWLRLEDVYWARGSREPRRGDSTHRVPVRVYRSRDLLAVAAPMAGSARRHHGRSDRRRSARPRWSALPGAEAGTRPL